VTFYSVRLGLLRMRSHNSRPSDLSMWETAVRRKLLAESENRLAIALAVGDENVAPTKDLAMLFLLARPSLLTAA